MTGFIVDYASYWSHKAGWFALGERFRKGIAIPTTIGVIYNTDNSSLLNCLKRRVFFTQNAIWHKFYWPPPTDGVQLLETDDGGGVVMDQAQSKLMGQDVYVYLASAAAALVVLCGLIAFGARMSQSLSVSQSRSVTESSASPYGDLHIDSELHRQLQRIRFGYVRRQERLAVQSSPVMPSRIWFTAASPAVPAN